MATKENGQGSQQPYNPSNGQYMSKEKRLEQYAKKWDDDGNTADERQAIGYSLYQPEAIKALLGEEFYGYKGQNAVDKLLKEERGHVKGAFYRDDVGSIDLFWGTSNIGLQHIIEQRKNKDHLDVLEFLSHLTNVVEKGNYEGYTFRGDLQIGYGKYVAIIGKTYQNHSLVYVLTSYRRHKKK